MKLTAEQIVKACGGILLCGDPKTEITSFSTDRPEYPAGCLLFPLKESAQTPIFILKPPLRPVRREPLPSTTPSLRGFSCVDLCGGHHPGFAENRSLVPVTVPHPPGGHYRKRGKNHDQGNGGAGHVFRLSHHAHRRQPEQPDWPAADHVPPVGRGRGGSH